jgi:hypothetical protein
MKKIALLITPLFLFNLLSAQETSEKPACLKPYSINFVGGMSFYHDIPFSMDEMRKIAPTSQFLQRDFSGFPQNNYDSYTINGNSSFGSMVEFVPYDKKKNAYSGYSTFRAGFNFTSFQMGGPSFGKQTSQPIDTLYPGNGSTIYDDSVTYSNYRFSWGGQAIGVDLSQVFHTNDQRIFSFWVGYGLHVGMVLNTVFRADYSGMKYLQTSTVTGPPNGGVSVVETGRNFDIQNETIKTKSAFCGGIYFPIGVQIRLSRKNNFWNKLAFTNEVRSSLDFQSVPGIGMLPRFYVNESLGLKYYFANNASK